MYKEKLKTHTDEPIIVREHEVIVPLFSLLKKTASRLMGIDVIRTKVGDLIELNDGQPIKIQMISKGPSIKDVVKFFTIYYP